MKRDPIIEIFAIGTELVLGRIQDTNSTWMARRFGELGGRVRRITQVLDDSEEIIRALADSVDRGTDLLIATGGLGPTPDDRTVDAVAEWLHLPVVESDVVIADYCSRRSLARTDLSWNLLRMARCPEGAEVVANPAGWAPCICINAGASHLALLPGPPKEVEALFEQAIVPMLSSVSGSRSACQRIKVDLWESEASPLMQATMTAIPGVYLKAYVALRSSSEERLPVDIVAGADDAATARLRLQEALDDFAARVREMGRAIDLHDGD